MDFDWISDFSVNVKKLDDQHKNLVNLVRELNQGKDGNLDINIEDILNRLVDYTKYHFRTEETLLEENGYSNLEKHKFEHLMFIRSVMEFSEKFKMVKLLITMKYIYF